MSVFQEAYGTLSEHQWKAYRKYNVSPSDHDFIIQVLGYTESDDAAIVCHILRNLRNGMYCVPIGGER